MKDYEGLSKKHFNKQAKDYDRKNTYYYSREGKISCRDVKEYLKDREYNDLLDVGCGTGFLFELLLEDKKVNYKGLDLSEEMIKMAKEKNLDNCEYFEGTSNKLPFDDEIFDVVTCIQSFHHYPYQIDAMKEAYRVLKKGGIYILSDTGIGGIGAFIDNNIIFKLINSGDCHTTNKKGIEKKMKKVGFNIESSRKIGKMIYTVVGKK